MQFSIIPRITLFVQGIQSAYSKLHKQLNFIIKWNFINLSFNLISLSILVIILSWKDTYQILQMPTISRHLLQYQLQLVKVLLHRLHMVKMLDVCWLSIATSGISLRFITSAITDHSWNWPSNSGETRNKTFFEPSIRNCYHYIDDLQRPWLNLNLKIKNWKVEIIQFYIHLKKIWRTLVKSTLICF